MKQGELTLILYIKKNPKVICIVYCLIKINSNNNNVNSTCIWLH